MYCCQIIRPLKAVTSFMDDLLSYCREKNVNFSILLECKGRSEDVSEMFSSTNVSEAVTHAFSLLLNF